MIKYHPTFTPDDRKRRIAAAEAQAASQPTYGGEKASNRYSRLAEAYTQAASDASPVGHWMQAVARGVQGISAGMYDRMARDEERAADERATRSAYAKEGRDHDRALELARAKALLEQQDPAYQANLAKTKAETDELSAKGKYRNSLMRMLNGEDDTPQTDPVNVGGPPLEPNPPVPPPPPAAAAPAPSASPPMPTPAPMPGVQPQSFNGTGMQPTPAVGSPPVIDAQPQAAPTPGGVVDPAARQRMAQTIAGGDVQAAPAPTSPSVRRMAQTIAGGEMPSPSQQPMPGIQLVADQGAPANPSPVQPQQAPVAAPQVGAGMIDTPYGPMTREKARRVGGAMMMDPQYATAGKALFDQAIAPNDPALTKPTVNAIQEKQLNAVEQYARLKSIKASWKPEYQTIENRLGFAWNSIVDKFGTARNSLTPQQRQELSEYSASRAEGLNNMNNYIKEITGAAMTIPEAQRIKQTQPNPGEGIFDGDSPIVFQSKMDTNIRLTEMALARYSYLTKNGFEGTVDEMAKQIPLDDMPKVIQRRTNQLLQESLNASPGATQQDVLPLVRQRLRAEFGIDA